MEICLFFYLDEIVIIHIQSQQCQDTEEACQPPSMSETYQHAAGDLFYSFNPCFEIALVKGESFNDHHFIVKLSVLQRLSDRKQVMGAY